jgi:FOG: CBS domain
MTKKDLFIEAYKRLEEVVRVVYHVDPEKPISSYLVSLKQYRKYSEDIMYCQDVRNVIQHKRKISFNAPIEPTQEMIDFVERLTEKIKNRKKCYDIQIKFKDVYWQSLNGNVQSAMKTMREKMYTHIPIMENGQVVGVFDENSIFCYLADDGIVDIDEKLTFEAIKEYCTLNGREMEEFLFFKASSYVEELENEFEKTFRNGKRIGMVFLTASGKSTEELQGILTPWDILAAN